MKASYLASILFFSLYSLTQGSNAPEKFVTFQWIKIRFKVLEYRVDGIRIHHRNMVDDVRDQIRGEIVGGPNHGRKITVYVEQSQRPLNPECILFVTADIPDCELVKSIEDSKFEGGLVRNLREIVRAEPTGQPMHGEDQRAK